MDNTAPQRTGNETIMVVDDTPANLTILVELLGRRGYRVRAFPGGSMALKAAALEVPDLMLLDIMMPGMDGLEICRRLREDEKLEAVIGGLHLVEASEERIRKTAAALEEFSPSLVAAGHCTGFRAQWTMHGAFREKFALMSSGTVFQFRAQKQEGEGTQ